MLLIKAGLSKEVFIGTAVVVSTFVDFTRLGVYAARFSAVDFIDNISLVLSATIAAISGAYFGNKLLKKVTLRFLQITVAVTNFVICCAWSWIYIGSLMMNRTGLLGLASFSKGATMRFRSRCHLLRSLAHK